MASDADRLTDDEIEVARARVREWPRDERESLTRMSEEEARSVLLLTALLDIRPSDA